MNIFGVFTNEEVCYAREGRDIISPELIYDCRHVFDYTLDCNSFKFSKRARVSVIYHFRILSKYLLFYKVQLTIVMRKKNWEES